VTDCKGHQPSNSLACPEQCALIILTYTFRSQWSDCGVREPWLESHRWQLRLSRQSWRYTALGTGCTTYFSA